MFTNKILLITVSTHPRTLKRLEKMTEMEMNPLVLFLKPFGFSDCVYLQMNALCTLSDSGTISEESAILNFQAISLRQSMERPEAQNTGSIILTGFDLDVILNSISLVIKEKNGRKINSIPEDYLIEDTSWRVVKLRMGNSKLSNLWNGIR